MVSIVVDYNVVQVVVWSILAIIAWLLRESTNKINDHLNTISNYLSVIQNTLNQIQISLGVSAVQIGRIEVKKASAEEIVKEIDGKLSRVVEVIDKIEPEEREEVV